MAYDIRFVKLIDGELVLGKYDAEGPKLKDVMTLQTIPAQQGVQMMLLPYGYPFEQDSDGEIDWRFVMYEYKKVPEELETRYIEAVSNITLAGPGMSNLDLTGGSGKISNLIKK